MNVLVTGGAGFIGSHVVKLLVSRGHHVDALLRPSAAARMPHHAEGAVTAWPADLLDTVAVGTAVRAAQPDAAVHLAWYTEPGRYLHHRPRNLESLAAGATLVGHLLETGCSRIVLGGTCLEGANVPGHLPTFYAVAKRALHHLSNHLGDENTSIACCHVFSVYGPGEDERRAVPSVVRGLLRGDPVAVSTGSELRDYVHVNDVAAALCAVVESDAPGTFDVCTGHLRPIHALFEEIGKATGRRDLIRWGARQRGPGEDFEVIGNPQALADLGWSPSLSFHEGIVNTVAWWRAQLAPAVTVPEA